MKPEFMRLRRAFAGTVAALLMATGIVVLSPAMSASAHHNTITVTASCTNYVWSINWTIVNSEYDKTETITSSSDPAIIAVGATIPEGGTYTKSETVPGPITKKLAISAKWSNGVTNSDSKTIYPADFKGTCTPPPPPPTPDSPSISIAGSSCATTSASDGTVAFTLTGVTKAYTVKLMSGGTTVATTTSSGGNGGFTNVAAGTYTITAAASGGPTATSAPVTVSTCAPKTPDIDLVAQTCRTGGLLGAVTANLSNLTVGSSYVITLYSAADGELETLPLTATAETFTTTFAGHGPGVYHVKVADQSGGLLTLSGDATIDACDTELAVTVQLQPCPMNGSQAPSTPAEREINVVVAGMEPSTVYTVQLVTNDAAHTVIDSTTTPGDTATAFTHTFTGVPSPGEYRVEVLGVSERLVSEPISAPLCNLTTLAPPEITLNANQCEGVGHTPTPMSARVIELDATKTYYVRVVNSSGTTAVGGEDQAITGVTTATVRFPRITAPGTYTAQLLIEPGKQLAATSADSVAVAVCLPTLAMTGPGVLVPLGSIAALLLTLGGAVVTGRLRRRMAL